MQSLTNFRSSILVEKLRLSEKALTHLETTTYRKRVGSYSSQFSGKIIEEDNNSLI